MRIEERKIYKFEELSDESKEHAIKEWRSSETEIVWQEELFESLKGLFKALNLKLTDYQLGLDRSYIKLDIDADTANLRGARALRWLENNLLSKIRITKNIFVNNRKEYMSYGSSYRVGKIKPCPFTGYCADDDFLKELTDNIKHGMTIKDSLYSLADTYQRLLQAEWDYQTSYEYIKDTLIANEYEFLENGTML